MSDRRRQAGSALILASGSPRRVRMLSLMRIPFTSVPSGIDERPPLPLRPLRLALWAAEAKARAVAPGFPYAIVLAADTVVALNGRAYGKPADPMEAEVMLKELSGRTHIVYTGVAVVSGKRRRAVTGFSRTFVTMRELSPSVIRGYVETGEAQDKAGAYAIQGEGRRLVRAIHGPFDNVVGMPMHLVLRLLREAGMKVPAIKADGAEHEADTQRRRSSRRNPRRTDPVPARRGRAGGMRTGRELPAGHNPEHGRGNRG
ncbi:MAG TPA: Maf family protein [Candidatus Dormibacteraeota bacterium]